MTETADPTPRKTPARRKPPAQPVLHAPETADVGMTQDVPPPMRKPASFGFAIWVVVTVLFIGVAVTFVTLAAPRFKAPASTGLAQSDTDVRLTALENTLRVYDQSGGAVALAQVQTLAARLASVQTNTVTPAIPEGMDARLTALEAAMANLTTQLAALDDFDARLNRLEAVTQSPLRGPAILLALDTLAQASAQSRPFAVELAALHTLAPDMADLEMLRPWAEVGTPARQALINEFPAIAAEAFEAARKPAADASVWDKTLYVLSRFITVRRTGMAAGDGVDAVLARAEHRVREGDLAAALDETGSLSGAAADTLKNWREGVENRLALEQMLARIRTATLARVMGQGAEAATASQTAGTN